MRALLVLLSVLATACTALTDFDRFHYRAELERDGSAHPDAGSGLLEDGGQLEHDGGQLLEDGGQLERDAGPELERDAGELEQDASMPPKGDPLAGAWSMRLVYVQGALGCFWATPTVTATWTITVSGSSVTVRDGASTFTGVRTSDGFEVSSPVEITATLEGDKLTGSSVWPPAGSCADGVQRNVNGTRP